MEVGRNVGAVTQAIAILRVLADAQSPLGVTAIARAGGLSPSTTLNILRTLVDEGMASQEPATKTYRLDFGVLELASTLINKTRVELLDPHLQRITTQFNATASVWRIDPDRKATLIGRVAPENGIHIQFRLATRLPAYAGAIGRMVAALGAPTEAELQAAFARIRWAKPIAFATFMEEIRQAREAGYAVDTGALIQSVTTVAAGIVGPDRAPQFIVAAHLFQGQLGTEMMVQLGDDLRALCAHAQTAFFGRAAATANKNDSI